MAAKNTKRVKQERMEIELPDDLYYFSVAEAKRRKWTLDKLINWAAKEYIKKHGDKRERSLQKREEIR